MADEPLRLCDRVALCIDEAARAIGLSEGAFREHLLPRCPKFRAGRSVRIPLTAFKRFLEDLAAHEGESVGDSVDDLFSRLDDDSE